MLTHETIVWAEHTNQALIFLKLDFSNAFDRVDWDFLFGAMGKLGIPGEFIAMTKLLLQDAQASVKVNGSLSPLFAIERGVRQGCPLAPYLFLIVAEVLNVMVKEGVARGTVKGIRLPEGDRQQVVAQFADDTSFTLLGDEAPVKALVELRDCFCLASGLVINWSKSSGHWNSKTVALRPPSTNTLNIVWVDGASTSKLLGMIIGMSLAATSVDSFLQDRVLKQLQYWCTARINSTGRGVIVNHLLLSSIIYFASIWGGTKAGIKKVTASIRNYMWSGALHQARTKVAWL